MQKVKKKKRKRKTLPFISLNSFFFLFFNFLINFLHMNKTSLLSLSFTFVLTCLSGIATWVHCNHQWCSLIVTMVFFSKRAWQSWGTIIFTRLHPNRTFHLLTTNLEKCLASQGAHLQIHLSPPSHFLPFFMAPQYRSKILIQVLFNFFHIWLIHLSWNNVSGYYDHDECK